MWNTVEHDFGSIKAGTKLQYIFTHNSEKIIRNTKPSCPCLSIYHKDKTLRVVWNTPDKIKESYDSYKYIYLTYPNNEMEMLTLKATLVP